MYRNFLVDIGVLELDFLSVNVTPLGCSIDLTFHHKLYSRTLVPLAVLLALYLFARFCSRVAQRLRDKEGAAKGSRDWEAARKWEGFGSSAIALALFIIFLLYPSTSSMIFSTFICEDIDDGQSYLRADYAINCASPEHQIATAFAVAMIFIYPIGTVRRRDPNQRMHP